MAGQRQEDETKEVPSCAQVFSCRGPYGIGAICDGEYAVRHVAPEIVDDMYRAYHRSCQRRPKMEQAYREVKGQEPPAQE